ncbi:MAG: lecithin retinol acyltransferase family protein [Phascolarctobacterium sp.]|nr:lecithin retinol acyltransferase family protein [Phascolarctobacterium sp.]
MLLYPDYSEILKSGNRKKNLKRELHDIRNGARTVANVAQAITPGMRAVDAMRSMSVREAKRKLKKGDHIYCNRSVYSHHGVYDGQGYVYEYGGQNGDFNGVISKVSIYDFADGDNIVTGYSRANFSRDEIVERAKSRLGENDYNVLFNNCEHFVHWCREGDDSISSLLSLDEDFDGLINNPLLRGIPDIGGFAGPLPGLGGALRGLSRRNNDEDDDEPSSVIGMLNPFKRFPF